MSRAILLLAAAVMLNGCFYGYREYRRPRPVVIVPGPPPGPPPGFYAPRP